MVKIFFFTHLGAKVLRGYSDSMKHEEITQEIIGAAMAVLNELKPGLDEKLYENALVIELLARGIRLSSKRSFRCSTRAIVSGRSRRI